MHARNFHLIPWPARVSVVGTVILLKSLEPVPPPPPHARCMTVLAPLKGKRVRHVPRRRRRLALVAAAPAPNPARPGISPSPGPSMAAPEPARAAPPPPPPPPPPLGADRVVKGEKWPKPSGPGVRRGVRAGGSPSPRERARRGWASDWLPPSGSGPWAGPRWAGLRRWLLRGLPLALRAGAGALRGASLTRGPGPPARPPAAASPFLPCTARSRRSARGELPAPRQLHTGLPGAPRGPGSPSRRVVVTSRRTRPGSGPRLLPGDSA